MLHETIMCLLGNVGGLFQVKIENNKQKIKMVDNLEFIHPAEVDICNKIAELGNYYRKICQFYDDYAFAKSYENKPLKHGLYLEMFCDALNTVVLKPYTLVITDLEAKLLKEHYLNVTYLQSHLEHYYSLFASLDNLITEIQAKKLHGCQIIDIVYKFSISGNEIIKDTYTRILTLNNEVMYKQLRDWMIYGNLDDKYGEFFIALEASNDSSKQSSQDERVKKEEEVEKFHLNEIEEALMGASKFSSKQTQFALSTHRLPSYVSLKIANMILFTGELLQLFKLKTLEEIYASSAPTDVNLSQNLSMVKLQNATATDKFLLDELKAMNSKLDVYSRKIWDISKQPFSIIEFETLIAEIRNFVSESVWFLIVEKYKLIEEFQKLKNMFLIGRGELFATFLDTAKALLNKPIDSNFEYSVNYFFQKSVSRMLLDDEEWITKFRVILNEDSIYKKKEASSDGWERIGLAYRVEWPFNTLLTSKVLKKYNEIFNYLLSIRRVQIELNQCFLLQMRTGTKSSSVNPIVWLTRNHMSFLVDNLQFYLQADVLESQFAELVNNIKMTKDFEQIRYTHDTFLTKIQYQSFMINKSVWTCLNDILDSCLKFSLLVNSYDEGKEFPTDKVDPLISLFHNQTHALYTTLKSLEKRQSGSHLEQLMTRLNFNNYLAEHNGIL